MNDAALVSSVWSGPQSVALYRASGAMAPLVRINALTLTQARSKSKLRFAPEASAAGVMRNIHEQLTSAPSSGGMLGLEK
mmetsp:Transcript_72097/g.181777  ORF Transcript_72097/g.181777 Transcript_72097/m.181777 type:complete len:80 (+) Transcript_72097:2-241(+)